MKSKTRRENQMINSINAVGHDSPASPIASALPNPPASEWITSAMDKVSSFYRSLKRKPTVEGGTVSNLPTNSASPRPSPKRLSPGNENLRLHKWTKFLPGTYPPWSMARNVARKNVRDGKVYLMEFYRRRFFFTLAGSKPEKLQNLWFRNAKHQACYLWYVAKVCLSLLGRLFPHFRQCAPFQR